MSCHALFLPHNTPPIEPLLPHMPSCAPCMPTYIPAFGRMADSLLRDNTSHPSLAWSLNAPCQAPQGHPSWQDVHRFEKISNIIKQFKLSCSKNSQRFSSLEVDSLVA